MLTCLSGSKHTIYTKSNQIVPLLSQSSHPLPSSLSKDSYDALVKRIQFGGDEVVKAKDGAGSATLSMAYAGAEFAAKILHAIKGQKGIIAPSYVDLGADPVGGAELAKQLNKPPAFFSANVELSVRERHFIRFGYTTDLALQIEGTSKIVPLGKITDDEEALIQAAIPELYTNIEKVCCFRRVFCGVV